MERTAVNRFLPQPILCQFNRHRPNRGKVVWDGMHYVGTCKGCHREIYRRKSKSWRAMETG